MPDMPSSSPPAASLAGHLTHSAETAGLSRLYDAGTIGAATRRRLQRNLDLETAGLTEPPQ
jgi:hypothetical protein